MLHEQNRDKKVFLWGFMGSGKSYSGRHLAEALQWPLIDLDTEIELAENSLISEIFSQKGEAYFRNVESQILRQIIATPGDMIISTGGGTPCTIENVDLMNQAGLTIYLKRKVSDLLPRLITGKSKRPLLAPLSDEQIEDYIKSKMTERRSFYEQAACTIQGFFSEDLIEALQYIVTQYSFQGLGSHPVKDSD